MKNSFHSYGTSFAILDHTVLTAVCHRWMHPDVTSVTQSGIQCTYPIGVKGWVDFSVGFHRNGLLIRRRQSPVQGPARELNQWFHDCKSNVLALHYQVTIVVVVLHCVPKISRPPASNTPNSVCSSWISTKYCTLHCLNISYHHTCCDVRNLPCVLSVTSLWRQSLFTLGSHEIHCYWQRDQAAAYPFASRLKVATLSLNFKWLFRMIVSMTVSNLVKKIR